MITSEYLHNHLNLVLRSFQKHVGVLSISVSDDLSEIGDPYYSNRFPVTTLEDQIQGLKIQMHCNKNVAICLSTIQLKFCC